MDVTFFAEREGCFLNSFNAVPENSILGGGHFTKEQISDLLGCFKCSALVLNDNLWLLSASFSERIAVMDDEQLKSVASEWSDEHSWHTVRVNAMDLAGHLLALKYAYLPHSNRRIFVLFE
ncbi:hypothetical protein PRUB_a3434 [Pseudoalteromonas rubra]|uniref:Uncharacterized protein n=1 Tax=Pseudoalteromonas rubra TaxID=43658 RepID=A0A8T0C4L0_9GAMM|nr:hypothetical protein [Pseudoalteromonas rubra]KAF7783613.1 hypothetical protein PRUB_a3434 [Pseudoalteromonas rubra]